MLFLFFLFIYLLSASASAHTIRRHAHPGLIVARGRFSGHGTWYSPGQGACGSHATSHDYIVAMNGAQYNQGSICYKQIRITNPMNGKSVGAEIQDECPNCPYGSLDMSPVVFEALSDIQEGRIPITWSFSRSSKRASESRASPPSSPAVANMSTTPRIPAFAPDGESGTSLDELDIVGHRFHGGSANANERESI